MKKLFEIVKIIDVEPFQAGDGDAFRFRLEILREIGSEFFFGKVCRLETYRLQPTFPQSEGNLPGWKSDALIFVTDEMFAAEVLSGNSVENVVLKFQAALKVMFP
jgi:hypothetical protein